MNQMVRILGSIDNASTRGPINHLIFTENEILQFQVMENRERVATLGSSTEPTPLSGLRHQPLRTDLFHKISGMCLDRGKEIEKHLDDHLDVEKGNRRSMNYSGITDIVLSGESIYSLHSLAFKYEGQEIKYFLVREGGRISDDVLTSYKNTLDKAFPGNWRLSKGVRMWNMGFPALKIGVLGSIPVSVALFLLAVFQHEAIVTALAFAAFLYVMIFGVLTGIAHQVFVHRRLRELQPTMRNH